MLNNEKFLERIAARNTKLPDHPVFPQEEFVNSLIPLLVTCKEGHEWLVRPNKLFSTDTICPTCAGKQKWTANRLQKLLDTHNLTAEIPASIVSHKKILVSCSRKHTWETTPHNLDKIAFACKQCKKYTTDASAAIREAAGLLNLPVVNNCIEAGGVRFYIHDTVHTGEQIVGKYHLLNIKKQNELAKFRSVQFFSDEWLANPSLILSKIRHAAKIGNALKIHARNCEIKNISAGIKTTFLNTFHNQGADRSQIMYGAFHKDKLVAVMSFCAPRVLMSGNSKKTGSWELSRFATDVSYVIPGIASKLLAHFKKNNTWTDIFSYADMRISNANLYKQLGFIPGAKINPPDYYYIVEGKRKHRWGYRKDVLKEMFPNYDPNKTEYETMQENGIDRLWGCGTMRLEMING